MTEPERTERESRYRGPLPGEVPLSRDSRPGGVAPGLSFDPVTGRVTRSGSVPDEARRPMSEGGLPSPTPRTPSSGAQPEPEPEPEPPSPRAAAPHVPDRGLSREQRRNDGRAMIPLLAQALATQLARLAADDAAAPDGWWLTPDR